MPAQAAVTFARPHEHSLPSKAKRDVFFPSGRGGSGNIRPSKNSTHSSQQSPSQLVPPSRERQRASTADKLLSSGRGGSGNIQPTASDLDSHPLTASILSQHSATQAQYEQRVREVHAESNVVRSSGRGGSGNISDPRRRSRSQEPKSLSKRHFFTKKGRERGARCDSVTEANDGGDRTSVRSDRDRRTTTCSSGSSNAWVARQSGESRVSSALRSSGEVTADSLSLSSGNAMTGQRRRGFVSRHSNPPSSMSSVASSRSRWSPPLIPPKYPRSWHTGSPGSSLRAHSPASVIMEDREYVSFLEL